MAVLRSADVVVDVQVGDACLICFDVESEKKKKVDSAAPPVGSVPILHAAPSRSGTWRRRLDSPGRRRRKRRIYISENLLKKKHVCFLLFVLGRPCCPSLLPCQCCWRVYTRPLMQLSVVLSKNVSTGNKKKTFGYFSKHLP